MRLSRSTAFVAVAAVAIVLAVAAGAGVGAVEPPTIAAESPSRAAAGSGGQSDAPARGGGAASDLQQSAACDYAALYDRTVDSVVQVRTQGGVGSGFVLRQFGGNNTSLVVTNQHVVRDASEVLVTFSEGGTVVGQVVGATVRTDLALVRVADTPGYVGTLALARSEPETGQKVAALGSPFGLERTMTSGIVSGVGRSVPARQDGEQFAIPDSVQTDAPINPGNSGGPLVLCSTGRVAGVNRAGGAEDIGFAVSADVVRRVVPDLRADGEVDYAFLGVQVVEVTPPVAEANDLPVGDGLMVVDTVQGTPAAGQLQGATGVENVSGFRVPVDGDVILSVDGTAVDTREDLHSYLLTETRPGDEVTLTVLRDGQRRNVTVTLVERPESDVG